MADARRATVYCRDRRVSDQHERAEGIRNGSRRAGRRCRARRRISSPRKMRFDQIGASDDRASDVSTMRVRP